MIACKETCAELEYMEDGDYTDDQSDQYRSDPNFDGSKDNAHINANLYNNVNHNISQSLQSKISNDGTAPEITGKNFSVDPKEKLIKLNCHIKKDAKETEQEFVNRITHIFLTKRGFRIMVSYFREKKFRPRLKGFVEYSI